MRRLAYLVIIITLLFIGISIGQGNKDSQTIQDEINEFEKHTDNYTPIYSIDGGTVNGIGQKGEIIIDKAFDLFLNLFKKLID